MFAEKPGDIRDASPQRSDDVSYSVSSKWVSDIETFLSQTRLCLLGNGVSHLVSYSRFVQLQKEVLTLLELYFSRKRGRCSGVSFIDTTRLSVCDNRSISAHKVFAGRAGPPKTSIGWFYGFKLHLISNEKQKFHQLPSQCVLRFDRVSGVGEQTFAELR